MESYAYNYSTLFSQKEQKKLPATDGYGKFVITLDCMITSDAASLVRSRTFRFAKHSASHSFGCY